MTQQIRLGGPHPTGPRLNAPFGARCFMTLGQARLDTAVRMVLMHRLALGAL